MAALRQTLSRLLSFVYFNVLIVAIRKTQYWRYRSLARTGALNARRYQPGDERKILQLFRLIFREDKSFHRWRWEYLENPYGKVNVVLLESDRAGVVGHYGGILVRFNLHGDVIPVSQIVDVMIHPAFRGRAALDRLARAYVQSSRDNGVRLLYGFNRHAIARSNRRFFGADLAAVSEWVHEISRSRPVSDLVDDEAKILPRDTFDARVDALWERIKGSYPCAAVRDSRYLNWRYSRRSDRNYTLWATADSSGRLVAMAVFGAIKSDGLILELLSEPEDQNAIAAALRASIAHFARVGKLRVRVWLSAHGKLRQCAQEAGFTALASGFHLNLLRLDNSLDKTVLTEDFYYTLGDYDVY